MRLACIAALARASKRFIKEGPFFSAAFCLLLLFASNSAAAAEKAVYFASPGAPDNSPIHASSDPPSLLAGEITASVITIKTTENGRPLSGQKINIFCTAGAVSAPVETSSGVYKANYTAPADKTPQLVTVIAANLSSPEMPAVALRIPIDARAKIPGVSEPGAKVFAHLGGRETEPVIADANGKFTLRVVVSPEEARSIDILAVGAGGVKTAKSMSIATPDAGRLFLVAYPQPVPAGGKAAARILVIVPRKTAGAAGDDQPRKHGSAEKGKGTAGDMPELSASDGTLAPPEYLGEGIYSAIYKSPERSATGVAVISAKFKGLAGSTEIHLSSGEPTAITLKHGDVTDAGGGAIVSNLKIELKGPDGGPVAGAAPELTATIGETGPVTDNGDGTYESVFTARAGTGEDKSIVTAEVPLYSLDAANRNALSAVTEIPLSVAAKTPAEVAQNTVESQETATSTPPIETATQTAPVEIPPAATATPEIPPPDIFALKISSDKNELTADGKSRAAITISAQAQDGSPVKGKTITMSADAGSISAAKDNGDGTYSAALISPAQIGIANITARYNRITDSISIKLIAGAPAFLTIETAQKELPADGQSSSEISVRLSDAANNPIENEKIAYTLKGRGALDISTGETDSAGAHMVTYTSSTAASQVSVCAAAGTVAGCADIAVKSPAADKMEISALPADVAVGANAPAKIEVKLLDVSGNPLPGRRIGFSHGADGGSLSREYADTDGWGICDVYYTPDTAAGFARISATLKDDPTITAFIDVIKQPGPAASLEISQLSGTLAAGSSYGAKVTALDRFGNVATGYSGRIAFIVTDEKPTTVLPGDAQLVNGSVSLDGITSGQILILTAAGSRRLLVRDVDDASITGAKDVTVSAAALTRIDISPQGPLSVAGNSSLEFTASGKDAYGNDAVLANTLWSSDVGAITAHTDAEATFRARAGSGAGAVVARSGAIADSVQVAVAAAPDHFVITGPAAVAAGAEVAYTLQAADADGNPMAAPAPILAALSANAPAGAQRFRSSTGGPDVNLVAIQPGNSSVQFFYYCEKSGAWNVSASSPGLSGGGVALTVAPAAAASFVMAGAPPSVTAGHAFPSAVTATAYDTFGNVAAGYAGSVEFTSTDAQASLPNTAASKYAFTPADNGAHTFPAAGFNLKTAGGRTVTVTDGAISASSANILVTHGAAAILEILPGSESVTVNSTETLAVHVKDAYGNPVDGESVTVAITDAADGQLIANGGSTAGNASSRTGVTDASGRIILGYVAPAGNGLADVVDASSPDMAQSAVTDAVLTSVGVGQATKLAVLPVGAVSSSAGVSFNITVEARDTGGVLANTAAPAVGLLSTSPTMRFSIDGFAHTITQITLVGGTTAGLGLQARDTAAGAPSVTARDNAGTLTPDTKSGITIAPGPLASFAMSGVPASVTAGQTFSSNITVTAYDAYGNVKTDYSGAAWFTSTDAPAALPYTSSAKYTFVPAADNGKHIFPGAGFRLDTPPSRTITVTNGAISNTTPAITVNSAPAVRFAIMNPAPGTVDAPISVAVNALDTFGNVDADYNLDVTLNASGAATGGGIVDIINGTGTLALSDTAAQTVILSLADTQGTGLDVSSTRNAVFSAGAPASFVVAAPASAIAGTAFNIASITAEDRYGNVCASYAGAKTLSFSGPAASADGFAPSYAHPVAFAAGAAANIPVTLYTAETAAITARDGAVTGTSGPIAVSGGTFHHYDILEPATAYKNAPFMMTVSAVDRYGNETAGSSNVSLTDQTSNGVNGPGNLSVTTSDTSGGADVLAQGYNAISAIKIRASDGAKSDGGWAAISPAIVVSACTLGAGLPVGFIQLPNRRKLNADGNASLNIISQTIKDCSGSAIHNGVKFTVATNKGTITNADSDPATPGIQVTSTGGKITITLQSDTIPGHATVRAESVTGDAMGETSVQFKASENPVVLQTSPANGASNVLKNAKITALFSMDMGASTITAGSFKAVQKSSGALDCTGAPNSCVPNGSWPAVSGAVSYDSNSRIATFSPSSLLVGSRCVEVCLTSSIYDVSHLNNLNSTSWKFTAGSASDSIAPVLTGPASASPSPFSPDGDGTNDTTTISVPSISDGVKLSHWRIEIKSGGAVIRTLEKYNSANGADSMAWDGFDQNGYVVDNNTYNYEITAFDEAGNASNTLSGTVGVSLPIIFTHFGP